jgi:membrane fusion protein, heavy metal efflux system
VARPVALLALGLSLLAGCAGERRAPVPEDHGGAGSWQVTAWGDLYEVFPEVGPLVAGRAATAHTHVTVLDGFTALEDGTVSVVLRSDDGAEEVFAAPRASRPGVFDVAVEPTTPGDRDLLFRVRSAAGSEEIRGGRVRVGPAEAPGGVVVAPVPKGATEVGEPLEFLKEQQWRTAFATEWVRTQGFADSVEGPALLRAPAGGEVRLTAPMDGVVQPEPWPWPGQPVAEGRAVLRLTPRVEAEESLGRLGSEVTELQAELRLAQVERDRARRLAEAGVVSRQAQDEAEVEAEVAEARLDAARRALGSARAARSGGSGAETLTLRAPFTGRVAEVTASPGAAVEAGDELARLVVTDPVWLEVALSPGDARRVSAGGPATVILDGAAGRGHRVETRGRFVSRAPEVDPHTGTLPVLLELTGSDELPLGSRAQARILLDGATDTAEDRRGIVIPESSLVDDGGVSVVYLQLSGERFVRQTVEVVARQGDRVLVEGLVPGQRLVTRGGPSLRRAALVSTGVGHGHEH